MDYSGFMTINPQRFGQKYVGKVKEFFIVLPRTITVIKITRSFQGWHFSQLPVKCRSRIPRIFLYFLNHLEKIAVKVNVCFIVLFVLYILFSRCTNWSHYLKKIITLHTYNIYALHFIDFMLPLIVTLHTYKIYALHFVDFMLPLISVLL